MSLLRPKTIEGDILHMGHIYDISPIPAQLIWYYSGKPVIPQKVIHEQKTPALSLGDERHQELLGAIKGSQGQGKFLTQIASALPRHRDWRH